MVATNTVALSLRRRPPAASRQSGLKQAYLLGCCMRRRSLRPNEASANTQARLVWFFYWLAIAEVLCQ
jgi:hypothetical protein